MAESTPVPLTDEAILDRALGFMRGKDFLRNIRVYDEFHRLLFLG